MYLQLAGNERRPKIRRALARRAILVVWFCLGAKVSPTDLQSLVNCFFQSKRHPDLFFEPLELDVERILQRALEQNSTREPVHGHAQELNFLTRPTTSLIRRKE